MDPIIIANSMVIGLIIITFIVMAQSKIDVVGFTLLFTLITCIVVAWAYKIPLSVFINNIPFTTIIYILSMNIIILVVDEQKVFQYFAVQIIHMTKSNPRILFYFLCIIAALMSGVMEDVSVAVIFIPLVIRATKILKIKIEPFIYGISLSITIGNLLSPLASPTNILIAELFQVNFQWFFAHLFPLFVILLFASLLFIDFKMVRKQPKPLEKDTIIFMEIMNPKLLIINRKRFNRNVIYIFIIFTALIISPTPYLIAFISAIIICLLERDVLSSHLKNVDWGLIFLLLAIFLIAACMSITGLTMNIAEQIIKVIGENLFVAVLIIVLVSSFISSFASKTLAVVMFFPIFSAIFAFSFQSPVEQQILLMALVIGVDVGGTLVPQAATYILKTINIARENKLEEINYQKFLKLWFFFTLFALAVGLGFLWIYSLLLQ